jgi:hypothetical protein
MAADSSAHDNDDIHCETKEPAAASPPSTTENYLSTHLIVPYIVNLHGVIKRPAHLIARWSCIFSYLGLSPFDLLRLRWLCRLFRDSLRPPGWTTFPHPSYSTLNKLVDQINDVAKKDPSKAPSVVFVAVGVHTTSQKITVRCSLMFVGESREGTVVRGNFEIKGDKEKDVVRLETMTVTNLKGMGVNAFGGAMVHMKELTVDGYDNCGVCVYDTHGVLVDCIVKNCTGCCGILSQEDGVIHMYGEKTKVTGHKGRALEHDVNSKLILHAPLTEESIS